MFRKVLDEDDNKLGKTNEKTLSTERNEMSTSVTLASAPNQISSINPSTGSAINQSSPMVITPAPASYHVSESIANVSQDKNQLSTLASNHKASIYGSVPGSNQIPTSSGSVPVSNQIPSSSGSMPKSNQIPTSSGSVPMSNQIPSSSGSVPSSNIIAISSDSALTSNHQMNELTTSLPTTNQTLIISTTAPASNQISTIGLPLALLANTDKSALQVVTNSPEENSRPANEPNYNNTNKQLDEHLN